MKQLGRLTLLQEGTRRRRAPQAGGIPHSRILMPLARYYGFTASNEMLFTPNFLLAPRALSEMNW